MKGLDLAEAYYNSHGAPMIASQFDSFARRITVGLVGPGSECFGFDDEISRDHDWGPGFCMWLTPADYEKTGAELQDAFNRLPQAFMGFGPRVVSPGESGRTGVGTINAFYRTHTGLDHPPETLNEWLHIPEQSLATCTNGRVFADPLGEFTHWRASLLNFYPEDVRLKKLASRCMTAAQAGQYNFARSLQRNEFVAVCLSEAKFCTDVLSLVFLLNKRYAPFYKWMHRAVSALPILGQTIHALIADLVAERDLRAKPAIIETICCRIIAVLKREKLSESDSDFLLDHARCIHEQISDPRLRKRFAVVD